MSYKDKNGAYVPEYMTKNNEPQPTKPKYVDPPKSSINLDDLMESYMLILYRETRKLMVNSAKENGLTKDESEQMRQNMKLVMELKKKEQELLTNLSDDEIKQLIESKLNESIEKS